jgi:branched-chain amino acid transport system substrate-binding protein
MKYVLVIACLLLAGCQTAHQDTITVGVVGPFTGIGAQFGEWGKQGFELAAQEIETQTGTKINFIYEDDHCEPAPTITALNKLRSVDNVQIAVGLPCGTSSKAGASWVTENDFVFVSAGDNFGHTSDNWYSTRFPIKQESTMLAEFAYTNKSVRRVGILYYNNEWGVTQAADFKRRFEALGGTVVGMDAVLVQSDFRTQLLKFKNSDADAVVMIYNTVGDMVNQIEELDMDVVKLADSQVENENSVTVGGENLAGIIYARPVAPNTPSVEAFATAYEAKYGHAPDTLAIDSHDALIVLVAAVQQCGEKNTACIRNAIQNTTALPAANGELTFSKDLWGFEKTFVIKTYRDGEWQMYTGQ